MSMKEFDKLCESMITDKPGSRKLFYDERQKREQSRILNISLAVFAVLMFVNTFVMENFYQWAEWSDALIIFAMLSYAVGFVLLIVKDCFFAVKEQRIARSFSIGIVSFLMIANLLSGIESDKNYAVLRDGVLSREFVMTLVVSIFAASILFYFVYRYFEKSHRIKASGDDAEE